MKILFFSGVITVLLCFAYVHCAVVGSTTAPSRQPLTTFLAADTDNTLLGFAAFPLGFSLQNNTTTCTFDDYMPVAGPVDLAGGALFLRQDIVGANDFNLRNGGTFWGNGAYAIEFPKSVAAVTIAGSNRPYIFGNIALYLNTDVNITTTLFCRGSCKINGRGNRLTLKQNSTISIRPGSQLILEDLELRGLKGNNVRCLTDQGSLVLRNVILGVDNLYTFSRGSILFEEDVFITGSNKFNYTTALSSTIRSSTTVLVDHAVTFSYAPRVAKSNLIVFSDETSLLYLNGCTIHSTRTGLQLQTGTLIFDNNVTLSSEAKSSGEAMTLKSNLNLRFLALSTVEAFGLIKFD